METRRANATRQKRLPYEGHGARVLSVAFSPDGTRIVRGSGAYGQPGEIKIWDAASGLETLTVRGQIAPVRSVAFSLDGTKMMSGSWDDTVKVWDASLSR